MDKQKTILVCPLDWGLGHATRCIPVIQEFIDKGNQVIIGTSGKQKKLLQKEFSTLLFIELKGYEVTYSKSGWMISKMISQLPKIKKVIDQEHLWLDNLIDEYKIDMVVSDNRYGLWSKKIKSILITHQLFVKAPAGEWIIEKILKKFLDNFDEVWIPDVAGENNFSGDLSHKKPLPNNYKFIGLLSRFSNKVITSSVLRNEKTYREANQFEFDFIAVLSGPEPQRTIFENIILQQVSSTNLKGILVRGLPDSNEKLKIENSEILIFNHLETEEFLNYIQKSKVVISRSGYSTIMDLVVLCKKAILIPTPGQTEQEYLAQYHQENGRFYSQKQPEFDLEEAVKKLLN